MNEQKQPTAMGPVESTVRPRDETLEFLSDKIRKGEPIDFLEALAVIDYQEDMRKQREANSWKARLKRWLCLT